MQTIIKLFQDIRREYQEAHDTLSDIEERVLDVSKESSFNQLKKDLESIWKQIESEDRLIWLTLHEAKEKKNPELFLKEVGDKVKTILGCSYNLISYAQSLRSQKREARNECTFIIEKTKKNITLSPISYIKPSTTTTTN